MFNAPQFHLLRPAEVASILAVAPASIYRWLSSGKLPAVRLSAGAVRIRSDQLQQFIAEHSVVPDNINQEAINHG